MLGVAGNIRVYQISSDHYVHDEINSWMRRNPKAIVLDIKFSTSGTHDEWGTDALIIYREG